MDDGSVKSSSARSSDEVLARAIRFCDYRERCTAEIRKKLEEWELPDPSLTRVLEQLADLGYVDDERFARSYAGSKFRVSGWGKVRIRAELRARQISEAAIEKALEHIGTDRYLEELENLLNRKKQSLMKFRGQELKGRLYRYAASKGYESGSILEVLNRILID